MRSGRREILVVLVALFLVPIPLCYAEEGFTFVQMCDTQLGFGGSYEQDVTNFRLAVKQINSLKPDFVVICGDLVNQPDDPRGFQDFNAVKTRFEVPCHCVCGNHDIGNTPTAASLARYRKEVGKDYYSLEHKGYTLVAVNTQLWKEEVPGESEKHDTWFQEALATAHRRKQPTLVCGHYPLFIGEVSEEEGYYNIAPKKRSVILGLFQETGVVAYLSGHAHTNFEHEFQGIRLVTSATTSRNFDGAPMGFRVWKVSADGTLKHSYVSVEGAKSPKQQSSP